MSPRASARTGTCRCCPTRRSSGRPSPSRSSRCRIGGRAAARRRGARTLAETGVAAAAAEGKPVRAIGQFRGANLCRDLPTESRRDSADWVLLTSEGPLWVTGRRPAGKGFQLDPAYRADTARWLEVTGKVAGRGRGQLPEGRQGRPDRPARGDRAGAVPALSDALRCPTRSSALSSERRRRRANPSSTVSSTGGHGRRGGRGSASPTAARTSSSRPRRRRGAARPPPSAWWPRRAR